MLPGIPLSTCCSWACRVHRTRTETSHSPKQSAEWTRADAGLLFSGRGVSHSVSPRWALSQRTMISLISGSKSTKGASSICISHEYRVDQHGSSSALELPYLSMGARQGVVGYAAHAGCLLCRKMVIMSNTSSCGYSYWKKQ